MGWEKDLINAIETMNDPKQFYHQYQADDTFSDLSAKMIDLIRSHDPKKVFEFGCGSGKNLKVLDGFKIVTCGLDISPVNVMTASVKHNLPFVVLGTEDHLGHLSGFDVCFTISVLDHIADVEKIINHLRRMAPVVYLAEATLHDPSIYYWGHNYEKHGFKKLDYTWTGADGNEYGIWKWQRWENLDMNDDLGITQGRW